MQVADQVKSCTIVKSTMHCLSSPTSKQLGTPCIVCQFWCETLTGLSGVPGIQLCTTWRYSSRGVGS